MINVCPYRASVDLAKVIQVGERAPGAPEDKKQLRIYIREALDKAHSLEDIGVVLRDFVAWIGLDNFNIGVYAPGANSDQTLYIFNGYDPQWWKIYYEREYVDYDPIMATSVQRTRPYEWHEIDFTKVPDPAKSMELYMEATRFKIMGGFSTRVLGPYGFQGFASFSTETPGKQLGDARDEVFEKTLLFLTEFVDACLRVVTISPGMVSLTEQQLAILQMSADGLPHKTIAHKVGVVERTIDYHIKGILKRLRRKTRSSAIATATQLGLIIRDVPLKTFKVSELVEDSRDDQESVS